MFSLQNDHQSKILNVLIRPTVTPENEDEQLQTGKK